MSKLLEFWEIKENKDNWSVCRKTSGLDAKIIVPKELCPDRESLEKYLKDEGLWNE